MKSLVIKPKKVTPNVVFEPEKGIFEIKGECRPEYVQEFFEPVDKWLDDFKNEIAENKQNYLAPIVFVFYLEYINSSTFKYLVILIKKIALLQQSKPDITIEWHYDDDDEDMRDVGMDLKELSETNIPFKCIPQEVEDE